jgi:hypothetical protein
MVIIAISCMTITNIEIIRLKTRSQIVPYLWVIYAKSQLKHITGT